jgi:hypothetical protein
MNSSQFAVIQQVAAADALGQAERLGGADFSRSGEPFADQWHMHHSEPGRGTH